MEDLLRCAQAGDPRAFETITKTCGPDLLRFVTKYLGGDGDAALDVLQDTFVQAWKCIGSLKDADHLRRWLFTVARCKAITWLRRRRPPRRLYVALDGDGVPVGAGGAQTILPPPPGAEEMTEYSERRAELHRAIARLPERYGRPLRLHYLEGLDTRRTAEMLGLPRTCVKMRLHRARIYLRRTLQQRLAVGGSRAAPRTPKEGGP